MIDRRCTTQHATSSKMSANFLKKALFHNQMFSVEVGIGSSVGLNKARVDQIETRPSPGYGSHLETKRRLSHGGYLEKQKFT